VTLTETDIASDLEKLSGEFPDWHVWLSSAGAWWAVRLGNVHIPKSPHPDWAMTVTAKTADGLHASLKYQKSISLPALSRLG
jgi:hypothetical protein